MFYFNCCIARSISEEFSSGDTPRFKDEEPVIKTDTMHASAVSGGSGTSSHYRPESSYKSDKSDKDKTKKERESEEKDTGQNENIKRKF